MAHERIEDMKSSALPKMDLNSETKLQASATFLNRDEITFHIRLAGSKILSAEIKSIACPECLKEIQIFKSALKKHKEDFWSLPLPEGSHHSAMLLREVLLKTRGEWKFPYKEEELCHCRNVSTAIVDACILGGTHNVAAIGEKTMAGTACGTCRPVTQMLIDYRLNEPD